MSITPRLNRLFAADGKCFDVAVDHGFLGERLSIGQANSVQSIADPGKSGGMSRALMAGVHKGATPEQAMKHLEA